MKLLHCHHLERCAGVYAVYGHCYTVWVAAGPVMTADATGPAQWKHRQGTAAGVLPTALLAAGSCYGCAGKWEKALGYPCVSDYPGNVILPLKIVTLQQLRGTSTYLQNRCFATFVSNCKQQQHQHQRQTVLEVL